MSRRGYIAWLLLGALAPGCTSEGVLVECVECRCVAGTWEELFPETSPPMGGESMVSTPDGVLLFTLDGGLDADEPVVVWRWDGASWTDVTVGVVSEGTAPAERSVMAAVYHAQAEHSVMVGGARLPLDAPQDETWSFSDGAWIQQSNAPERRISLRGAYHAAEQKAIFFGGLDSAGGLPSTTWRWDGSSWEELDLESPAGRVAPGLAYDEARTTTVLFGGRASTDLPFDETWLYREGQWAQALPSVSPTGRHSHTLTYYPDFEVTVLFGGNIGDVLQNDLWQWDGATWKPVFLSTSERPVARHQHVAAYDAANRGILVFGGREGLGSGPLNDTWLFRLEDVDAATGQCCGDGVCQFPEFDLGTCPADCPP